MNNSIFQSKTTVNSGYIAIVKSGPYVNNFLVKPDDYDNCDCYLTEDIAKATVFSTQGQAEEASEEFNSMRRLVAYPPEDWIYLHVKVTMSCQIEPN